MLNKIPQNVGKVVQILAIRFKMFTALKRDEIAPDCEEGFYRCGDILGFRCEKSAKRRFSLNSAI
jgi:hypothetical protein